MSVLKTVWQHVIVTVIIIVIFTVVQTTVISDNAIQCMLLLLSLWQYIIVTVIVIVTSFRLVDQDAVDVVSVSRQDADALAVVGGRRPQSHAVIVRPGRQNRLIFAQRHHVHAARVIGQHLQLVRLVLLLLLFRRRLRFRRFHFRFRLTNSAHLGISDPELSLLLSSVNLHYCKSLRLSGSGSGRRNFCQQKNE